MTETQPTTIRLHPNDNVVVARDDIAQGNDVASEAVAANVPVPAGHKIATQPIAKDEPVRKYDQIIGFATAEIKPGDHVHTHNVMVKDFDRDYMFGADITPVDYIPENERADELAREAIVRDG